MLPAISERSSWKRLGLRYMMFSLSTSRGPLGASAFGQGIVPQAIGGDVWALASSFRPPPSNSASAVATPTTPTATEGAIVSGFNLSSPLPFDHGFVPAFFALGFGAGINTRASCSLPV